MSYDVDPGSVLLNRGLNGVYGYGGNGNFLGDGSAVKEAVRGNRDLDIVETVNRTQSDQALRGTIIQGNEFLTDRINQQFSQSRFDTLERSINTIAIDAQRDRTDTLMAVKDVLCCCEANSAKIDNLATLNTKDLEITKLQLQLAACQGN